MGPKIPDLRVFGVEFENTIVIFETNTPNLSNCKISRTRMSKFGTKSLICIFLCWNLKGLLSYLKSASLNLSCCKVSAKVKILTFGAKNVLFGYFWARISKKNYCHNWNKHPRICLIAKFWEKTKTSKYGTKNALSGYFWAGIWKQYYHVRNQHPKFVYLQNFVKKAKIPKFVTKNSALRTLFLYWNLKILLSYLESASSYLSCCKVWCKNS